MLLHVADDDPDISGQHLVHLGIAGVHQQGASEVKRKDGTKEYYLYPHSRGRDREAMVAKGSRPDGSLPFGTTAKPNFS